jgi:hypothetical protein
VITPSNFWSAVIPGTAWIANQADTNAVSGTYTYLRQFELQNASGPIQLDIELKVDDRATIILNGYTLMTDSGGHQQSTFLQVTDTNFFVLGTNTLRVDVQNDFKPHGLDMKAILRACPNTLGTIISAPSPVPVQQERITLHPNPTTGTLYLSGLPVHNKVTITVIDLSGKALISSNAPQVNVQSLADGIYLLRVTTPSGTTTLRFVKQ